MSDGFLVIENSLWLFVVSFVPTAIGAFVALHKHLNGQKENRKIKIVAQIEYYERQFFQLYEDYHKSEKTYDDCYVYARHMNIVLDRKSSKKKKKLITDDVVEYFQFWFSVGETFQDWIEIMERRGKDSFPSFCKIKDQVKAKSYTYELEPHFKYFYDKKLKNSQFKPHSNDKSTPTSTEY